MASARSVPPRASPQQLLSRRRANRAPQRSDHETGEVIESVFTRHRRRYGYRRIWQELNDNGLVCAPDWIRRGAASKPSSPRPTCPGPATAVPTNPRLNLLLDQPLPEKPNQTWAGDSTFIPTHRLALSGSRH